MNETTAEAALLEFWTCHGMNLESLHKNWSASWNVRPGYDHRCQRRKGVIWVKIDSSAKVECYSWDECKNGPWYMG